MIKIQLSSRVALHHNFMRRKIRILLATDIVVTCICYSLSISICWKIICSRIELFQQYINILSIVTKVSFKLLISFAGARLEMST